jgi:hypothetical protein
MMSHLGKKGATAAAATASAAPLGCGLVRRGLVRALTAAVPAVTQLVEHHILEPVASEPRR